MNGISWEEFWWDHITGAHMVVSRVADALLEHRIVVLKVPPDLPWRHSMRSSIHTAFQERAEARDVVTEPVDAVDDNPEDLEPGRFLLQRYASPSVAMGYREKSKITIQNYIAQKGAIRNRIIWVKGLDGESADKWVKFCRGFTPKTAAEGLFVLEIHSSTAAPESRHMAHIDFSEYVSSYDVQIFNSFVLDDEENTMYRSDSWKKYISATAALVCGTDAELSEHLIREVDFRNESAIDGIARMAEMLEFSRRGAGEDSGHVLWLFRHNKIAELNHRIWVSQVQVLFPIIEMERIEMTEKYREALRKALAENHMTQYGEQITDPADVELGSLCYMMGHKQDASAYMLYIPDEADRERIRFLHECRNLLAHVSCCGPSRIRKLLDRE